MRTMARRTPTFPATDFWADLVVSAGEDDVVMDGTTASMEDADASRADEEAYDDEDDSPEKVSASEEDIDACDDQNHSDEP